MKKRSRIWVGLVGLALVASMLSCTTYAKVREEIVPCVTSCLVTAAPELMLAVWQDTQKGFSWVVGQMEGVVGYRGPSDTVPLIPGSGILPEG